MKRTWLITGMTSNFAQRLIQNLAKKSQSSVKLEEHNHLPMLPQTATVDLMINGRG
ncbi:hypothetical protein [Secundilactobacillus collinoides]|uniref:Uncharacterized protein n=1 Tax=Secundilactobacillus collinoides DSM 20515 = JCM 1123 TaxID=1423733 RepID=A0A0R2B782_SECCO|nr:hypothetical protein [Secundilactobacillus collinoides]KRM75279.1 hypothetical protein FC82_GL002466 [Secundilactobacillus collinoides DSM 20515 = JCM 1123]